MFEFFPLELYNQFVYVEKNKTTQTIGVFTGIRKELKVVESSYSKFKTSFQVFFCCDFQECSFLKEIPYSFIIKIIPKCFMFFVIFIIHEVFPFIIFSNWLLFYTLLLNRILLFSVDSLDFSGYKIISIISKW